MNRNPHLVFEYAITAVMMVVIVATLLYFLVLGPAGPDVPLRVL